eukprot:TRINITY_DN1629_c0_g1_i6.p1 TRINITY_DN1629_c0_g1~~TRINITY_DN1629_c0_g1_i6.p1  ORF type:complete len:440 (-),score=96.24 TRINITY_DN1629_c0_g1_i6:142-1461(-)
MRTHGYYATHNDLHNIVNRLDKDKDGRVSYLDFLESMMVFKFGRSARAGVRSGYGEYRAKRGSSVGRMLAGTKEASVQTEVDSPTKGKDASEVEEEHKEFSLKPKKESEIQPNMTEEVSYGLRRPPRKPPSTHEAETEIKQTVVDEEIKESRRRPPKQATKEPQEKIKEETNEELMKRIIDTEPVIDYTMVKTKEQADSFKTPLKPSAQTLSPEHPTTGATPAKVEPDLLSFKKQCEFLISFFNEQLEIDRRTERTREKACTRGYAVQDLMCYFTRGLRESVSILELREGLEKQGIYKSYEELMIAMKRYDLNRDGALNRCEFEAMVLPKDNTYREMLGKGQLDESAMPRELLQAIISNEMQIERLRSDFNTYLRIYNRSLRDVFNVLAQDQDYITADHVKGVLEDVELLMERYDKDRDGKISFSELLQEITPSVSSLY